MIMTENNLKTKQNTYLPPISELYSTDNLNLQHETKVKGQIKQQSAIISIWKSRIFVLTFLPYKQLRMDVFKTKNGKNQQGEIDVSFDLIEVKMTKKCLKLQDKPCFGIVKGNNKYLISIANIHECAKFHGDILLAKQSIKDQSLQRINIQSTLSEQINFKKGKEKVQKEKQILEQEINDEEQEKIIEKRYNNSSQNFNEQKQQNQPEATKTFCQPSSSHLVIENLQSQSHLQCHLTQQQANLLQKDKGFHLHSMTQMDQIFMKSQHKMKVKMLLYNKKHLNDCVQNFFRMQKWNSAIKEFKIIKQSQEGLYIAYIQFAKQHHIEFVKYTYVVITLWQQKDEKLIIMRSLKKDRSQHQSILTSILKTRINMKMLIKINQDHQKPENKLITLCLLSDSASDNMCMRFMSQIHKFHKFLDEQIDLDPKKLIFKQGRCCQPYCQIDE